MPKLDLIAVSAGRVECQIGLVASSANTAGLTNTTHGVQRHRIVAIDARIRCTGATELIENVLGRSEG